MIPPLFQSLPSITDLKSFLTWICLIETEKEIKRENDIRPSQTMTARMKHNTFYRRKRKPRMSETVKNKKNGETLVGDFSQLRNSHCITVWASPTFCTTAIHTVTLMYI